jgi:hypothetical protein
MPGITPDLLLLLAAVVAISALVIGSLAYFFAKRRAVWLFLACVTALWCVIGWWIGHSSSISSFTPNRIPEWRYLADALLSAAPFAFLPALLTIGPVLGKAPMRRIPALAVAGSFLAVPCAILLGLASSCYIAFDCP